MHDVKLPKLSRRNSRELFLAGGLSLFNVDLFFLFHPSRDWSVEKKEERREGIGSLNHPRDKYRRDL